MPGGRPKPECRPGPEAFGRGAVFQNEVANGDGESGPIERLGRTREPVGADSDVAGRLGQQVQRPIGIGIARSDQQGAIRLLDEADCGNRCRSGSTPVRLEDRDPAGRRELRGDRQGSRFACAYFPRCCQDLPSVWTDGA